MIAERFPGADAGLRSYHAIRHDPGRARLYNLRGVRSATTPEGSFLMTSSIRRALFLIVVAALPLGGCASAVPDRDPAGGGEAMNAALAFVDALSNADMDALLAAFRDDATVFMPFESIPRRVQGKEEIRAAFAPMFERLRASGRPAPYMKIVPRDVETQVYGTTAIITFHLGALPAAGATEPAAFSRRTIVVTREGERWLIAHLHASSMRIDPPKAS